MSLRLGALCDALLNPGNPQLARAAAEEVAAYGSRIARIESRVQVLTWIVGFLIVLTFTTFVLALSVLPRLPQ